jgi:hypothetical protein
VSDNRLPARKVLNDKANAPALLPLLVGDEAADNQTALSQELYQAVNGGTLADLGRAGQQKFRRRSWSTHAVTLASVLFEEACARLSEEAVAYDPF